LEQASRDAAIPESEGVTEGNSMITTRSGTPEVPEGSSATYVDPASANVLRNRLNAMASERDSNDVIQFIEEKSGGTSYSTTLSSISDIKESSRLQQHPLVSHPDPVISALAKDYSDFQAELVSPKSGHVTWPHNISWKNFAEYQLIPTLVYELEYPRTNQCALLLHLIIQDSDLDSEFDLFMSLRKQSVSYISLGLH
jgi:sterol O-acyltransferase